MVVNVKVNSPGNLGKGSPVIYKEAFFGYN